MHRRDEGPILAAGKVGGILIENNLMDLLDLCDMGVEKPLDLARPRASWKSDEQRTPANRICLA